MSDLMSTVCRFVRWYRNAPGLRRSTSRTPVGPGNQTSQDLSFLPRSGGLLPHRRCRICSRQSSEGCGRRLRSAAAGGGDLRDHVDMASRIGGCEPPARPKCHPDRRLRRRGRCPQDSAREGAAVFLTRASRDVPPVMLWHLQHNRTLHEQLMVLTVRTASVPWTAPSKRLSVQPVARNFWRAEAIFGGTAISTHCGLIAF